MVPAVVLFLAGAWLLGRLRRSGLGGWLASGAAFMILFVGGQPQRSDVTAALIVGALILIGVRGLQFRWGGGERRAGR